MPANPFGERIARTYEAKWPELFDPAAGGRARVVLEDAGVYGMVVLRPGGAAR